MEEALEQTAELQEVTATMDTSESASDKKMRMAKVVTIPNSNIIQGKVTNEKENRSSGPVWHIKGQISEPLRI